MLERRRTPLATTAAGHRSHHLDTIDISLSPVERCSSSTPIPWVTWKHCRIFTDIFRVVRVLDHTFDAVMPSSYVWIPSEVLHVRH
jgi:hypothetical protein